METRIYFIKNAGCFNAKSGMIQFKNMKGRILMEMRRRGTKS